MEVKGLRCKTSRVSYVWNYFLILLSSFFLILLLPYLNFSDFLSQLIFIIIFSIILILLLEPESEKIYREYIITDNEIKKIEGIFSKREVSIPFQSIADITLVKSLVGRILNFGNVLIKGVDGSIVLKGLRNPERIVRIIEERMKKESE